MLTPEQLNPEAVRPGVFVEVLIDSSAHRVTPVPAQSRLGWGCQQCAYARQILLANEVKRLRASRGQAPAGATPERQYISPVSTVADLVNNLMLMDQSLPIYGAQYIEHAGRRRCIEVYPIVSRERVKDSRWIGEGDDLNAAVIWTRATQPDAGVLEDVALLDFLVEHRAYVVSDPDACPGYWLHWARPDGTTWVQADEHATPRDAIRAAIAQQKAGE